MYIPGGTLLSRAELSLFLKSDQIARAKNGRGIRKMLFNFPNVFQVQLPSLTPSTDGQNFDLCIIQYIEIWSVDVWLYWPGIASSCRRRQRRWWRRWRRTFNDLWLTRDACGGGSLIGPECEFDRATHTPTHTHTWIFYTGLWMLSRFLFSLFAFLRFFFFCIFYWTSGLTCDYVL